MTGIHTLSVLILGEDRARVYLWLTGIMQDHAVGAIALNWVLTAVLWHLTVMIAIVIQIVCIA